MLLKSSQVKCLLRWAWFRLCLSLTLLWITQACILYGSATEWKRLPNYPTASTRPPMISLWQRTPDLPSLTLLSPTDAHLRLRTLDLPSNYPSKAPKEPTIAKGPQTATDYPTRHQDTYLMAKAPLPTYTVLPLTFRTCQNSCRPQEAPRLRT